MTISDIEIKNFRNYEDETLQFCPEINVLYGDNAQGKTNILEAIYICVFGKSFRSVKDNEIISYGKNEYRITLNLKYGNNSNSIRVIYNRESNKKSIYINDIPIKKYGELIGYVNCVLFSPEDILMVKEGPSLRRKKLNLLISQLKPTYLYNLQQYNKVISQKNALLKNIKNGKSRKEDLIIWNERIAEISLKVIKERMKYVGRLSNIAKEKHLVISENKEDLDIEYIPFLSFNEKLTDEDNINIFLKEIEKKTDEEIIRGISLVGIHKDDVNFIINNKSLKKYGSQGQQRSSVLSYKTAEIEIIKEDTGKYPIFLLDDVMSELDPKRREMMMNELKSMQAVITCTEKEIVKEKRQAKFQEIIAGKLQKRKE